MNARGAACRGQGKEGTQKERFRARERAREETPRARAKKGMGVIVRVSMCTRVYVPMRPSAMRC